MADQVKQKCPNCGAPLHFDPASGKLVCDYCDSVFDIDGSADDKPDSLQGFDFHAITEELSVPDAENLPIYVCRSCGAELIAPAEQSALTCPYCGNNIVLTDKVSGHLRPNGIIPFRIQSKDLPDAVNRFYRGKKLLPKRFFSESTMGKVTGVYVPFWVFNGDLSGEVGLRASNSHSRRSGDYIIKETSYYKLLRRAFVSFKDLPVDAGSSIDNALMDSLEPFDLSEVKPFDMRYLAGFTADRFDDSKKAISDRAESRMRSSAIRAVEARSGEGYGTVSLTASYLNADLDAKYILFPVYMFSISYNGAEYQFAVNGQTGKVVGSVPTSKSVSRMYFLKRFGIVAGALAIISIVKYFLGF